MRSNPVRVRVAATRPASKVAVKAAECSGRCTRLGNGRRAARASAAQCPNANARRTTGSTKASGTRHNSRHGAMAGGSAKGHVVGRRGVAAAGCAANQPRKKNEPKRQCQHGTGSVKPGCNDVTPKVKGRPAATSGDAHCCNKRPATVAVVRTMLHHNAGRANAQQGGGIAEGTTNGTVPNRKGRNPGEPRRRRFASQQNQQIPA